MSDDDDIKARASKSRGDNRGSAAERAWEIRRARMRRIARRFVIVVGVPTILAIGYYTVWAADEYVSETVVNVHAPAESSHALGSGNFVANRPSDLALVRQTIHSHSTLEKLISTTDWRAHYRDNGDLFSRLDSSGSEKTYSYFREHVQVTTASGAPLRLRVRAFSGDAAADFAAGLLTIAEERVNEIALRPIDDQLAKARARADVARKELEAIQRSSTPAQPPEATPPALVAASERLAAAEAVVKQLELVRDGQTRYLTVVSGPSRPDEASYPRRVWGVATVFVVAFALMGIFSLLFGAVREHAKV